MITTNFYKVKKFLQIISADSLERKDRVSCLYALCSENLQNEAKDWLSASYKKSKVASYAVDSLCSDSITIGTLFHIAKNNGVDFSELDDRGYNHTYVQKKQTPKKKTKEEKAKIADKKTNYERKLYYFKESKPITSEQLSSNTYFKNKLPAVLESPVHFSNAVRVDNYNNIVRIKADNADCIQTIYLDKSTNEIKKTIAVSKTGDKSGAYAIVSKIEHVEDKNMFIVVEGISTAMPFVQSNYGHTVWAIDAGNLTKVVKNIKDNYPGCEIVIGADNDKSLTGEKSAGETGEKYILPYEAGTDFNDEWKDSGVIGILYYLSSADTKKQGVAGVEAKIKELRENITVKLQTIEETENYYSATLQARFLSNELHLDDLYKKITLIKSTQETGKTYLNLKLVKETIMAGGKCIIVGYSRNLTRTIESKSRELAKVFGLKIEIAMYSDFNNSSDNLFALQTANLIIITPESLYKLEHINHTVDLLIIDEFESVSRTFCNDATHKKRLSQNRNVLHRMIAKSKTVVAVDADIGELSKMHVRHALKEDNSGRKPIYLTNTFKHYGRKITEFKKISTLRSKIIACLQNNECIAIAVTSKKQSKLYYKIAGKNSRVLLITGDNYTDAEVVELTKTLDATQYDCIIYTMALGVGVDIATHNCKKVFIDARHITNLSPECIKQMAQRFRFVDDYYIAYSGGAMSKESHRETDIIALRKKHTDEILKDYSLNPDKEKNSIYFNDDGSLKQDSHLLDEVMLNQSLCNDSFNNWKFKIRNSFTTSGFSSTVDKTELSEEDDKAIKHLFDEAKKSVEKQESREQMETPVSSWLAYNNQTADNKRLNSEDQKVRSNTESMVIHKDMKDKVKKIKFESDAIHRPYKLKTKKLNIKILTKSDLEMMVFFRMLTNENLVWWVGKTRYFITREVLQNLVALICFDIKKMKTYRNVEWSSADFKIITAFFERHEIITTSPIKTFNTLLGKIGILVDCVQQNNGERVYSVGDFSIFENIVTYIFRSTAFISELELFLEKINVNAEALRQENSTEPIQLQMSA